MRTAKQTADEIQAAEQAKDNRKSSRRDGFGMMELRDRGAAIMSNGVRIEWHVPKDRRDDWVGYSGVPDGMFLLNGVLYDGEEMKKWLRWV